MGHLAMFSFAKVGSSKWVIDRNVPLSGTWAIVWFLFLHSRYNCKAVSSRWSLLCLRRVSKEGWWGRCTARVSQQSHSWLLTGGWQEGGPVMCLNSSPPLCLDHQVPSLWSWQHWAKLSLSGVTTRCRRVWESSEMATAKFLFTLTH